MGNINRNKWSDEEAALIHNVAFVAALDRVRMPSSKKEPRKSSWERFLNSLVGVALISFLTTGIFGSLITGMVQSGLKEREFQKEWMKSRGDQALVVYKEYLQQEQNTVNDAYGLIGRCLAASDEIIELTRPYFDPKNYPGVQEQKLAIRRNFNVCDRQWREQSEKIGLLMSYYHPNRPEVTSAWKAVQDSVSEYMRCAQNWYLKHGSDYTEADSDCEQKKQELISQLGKLNENINAARQYAWEGWESPEKLRVVLENKQ
jgi:glycerol-3-phosphate cytidylyltransferase-like family protein